MVGDVSDIKTFEDAEVRLAEALPGYESRPQQQALARAIEAAIDGEADLMAEAGCGTGKSLGYLIPAILSGKRAVISTATKALQDQIATKDLPFLAGHLGVDFTYTLVKGRSNYVCLSKLADSDERAANEVQVFIGRKADEGDTEFSGERDELPFEISNKEWSAMSASGDECPGKSVCPMGEVCYAERVKARAQESDIVVVNHALFFTDLLLRSATGGNVSMIGEYEVFVADEAHELEDWATNMLGMRLSEASVTSLISNLRRSYDDYTQDPETGNALNALLSDLSDAMGLAWDSVTAYRPPANDRGFRDSSWTLGQSFVIPPKISESDSDEVAEFKQARIEQATRAMDSWIGLLDALRAVTVAYKDGKRSPSAGDKEYGRYQRVGRSLSAMNERILDLLQELCSDDPSLVAWAEVETSTFGGRQQERVVVRTAPIDVGDFMRTHLWGNCTSILASATLSLNGSFEYVASRIGMDDYLSIDVGTPFDYEKQSRLYVPANISSPKSRDWATESISHIARLVNASEGRALLLFTSSAQMKKAHAALSGTLEYQCLMQGQQPNRALAEAFMADTDSVLFATKSFFTGVDFQGDACSLVVIDKLPFLVPTDPVVEARSRRIERNGGNSFSDLTIPHMSLVLKQGFGRLIRHRNDRGVVAILDSRLVNQGWGQKILRSLPDAPLLTKELDVGNFYREVPVG